MLLKQSNILPILFEFHALCGVYMFVKLSAICLVAQLNGYVLTEL